MPEEAAGEAHGEGDAQVPQGQAEAGRAGGTGIEAEHQDGNRAEEGREAPARRGRDARTASAAPAAPGDHRCPGRAAEQQHRGHGDQELAGSLEPVRRSARPEVHGQLTREPVTHPGVDGRHDSRRDDERQGDEGDQSARNTVRGPVAVMGYSSAGCGQGRGHTRPVRAGRPDHVQLLAFN
ncbi:hypothetical protein OIM90_08445 [Streptomyces sp. AD16]|nr:hypothetical protein OIM90_08445 [Streptomyces sp. AD16]